MTDKALGGRLKGDETDGATVERAYIDQGSLWVPQGELAAINGFELKPQGLCRGPLCIPVPQGAGWSRQVDGKPYFNLSAFSKKIGQAAKADSSESVWSFSLPTKLNGGLASGMAPDFALPTVDGKIVRLSDFRGKKVLILTWASW